MSVFFIWLPKNVTFWSISIWQTWNKVFKNRPSETFKREPLKNLKWFSLIKHTISLQIHISHLKVVSHKFRWARSWILCPAYSAQNFFYFVRNENEEQFQSIFQIFFVELSQQQRQDEKREWITCVSSH